MSPFRILLVAPTPPPYGGMALQAAQLERLLLADGHSVTLFASNFPCPLFLGRVPLVRTLIRLFLIWPKLWNSTGGADLVHVLAASWYYFFAVVYPAVLIGRLRGKRVVVNYRGGEGPIFFEKFGWLASPVLRLAHRITAPSAFLAEVIERRFRIPVLIVPNILTRSKFPYRERIVFEPKLLVTRHLEEIYDIPSVLRAFSGIQSAFPEASLIVAGTGGQEGRLRVLSTQLGLRNVRWAGGIAHAELAALYGQSDIYLNASRVDNFPGALIEASSAGLAVVSTDAGGIPHIYSNEKDALLAPVGDWEKLAESVIRLVRDPRLARQLVKGGLRVAEACAWERVRPLLYRSYGIETGPHRATCEVVTELH